MQRPRDSMFVLGLAFLGAGLGVYALLRPAAAGAAALWLPSLLHPLAFGLMCAALLPARWRGAAGLAWGVVNALFEFGQHPALHDRWAALPPWLGAGRDYFLLGVFDGADVAASLLGGALAAALCLWIGREAHPHEVHA